MNYWEGIMNWPIIDDWKCQTCGWDGGLTWGMVHARCRCNRCHTEYDMRNDDGDVVDVPICMLKEEYKKAAKVGYETLHKPISEFTDAEWEVVMRESAT